MYLFYFNFYLILLYHFYAFHCIFVMYATVYFYTVFLYFTLSTNFIINKQINSLITMQNIWICFSCCVYAHVGGHNSQVWKKLQGLSAFRRGVAYP